MLFSSIFFTAMLILLCTFRDKQGSGQTPRVTGTGAGRPGDTPNLCIPANIHVSHSVPHRHQRRGNCQVAAFSNTCTTGIRCHQRYVFVFYLFELFLKYILTQQTTTPTVTSHVPAHITLATATLTARKKRPNNVRVWMDGDHKNGPKQCQTCRLGLRYVFNLFIVCVLYILTNGFC